MTRPVPVADELSAPYWAAAARHVLVVARCGGCGRFAHPPEVPCVACGCDAPVEWHEASGRGRVRSWTVVRQPLLPGFDALVPYVLVDVELAEHPALRLTGRLLDGVAAPIAVDRAVLVAFEDVAEGVAIPAFVLA